MSQNNTFSVCAMVREENAVLERFVRFCRSCLRGFDSTGNAFRKGKKTRRGLSVKLYGLTRYQALVLTGVRRLRSFGEICA